MPSMVQTGQIHVKMWTRPSMMYDSNISNKYILFLSDCEFVPVTFIITVFSKCQTSIQSIANRHLQAPVPRWAWSPLQLP